MGAARRQSDDGEPVTVTRDDVQSLGADGTGRPEDDHGKVLIHCSVFFRVGSSLSNVGERQIGDVQRRHGVQVSASAPSARWGHPMTAPADRRPSASAGSAARRRPDAPAPTADPRSSPECSARAAAPRPPARSAGRNPHATGAGAAGAVYSGAGTGAGMAVVTGDAVSAVGADGAGAGAGGTGATAGSRGGSRCRNGEDLLLDAMQFGEVVVHHRGGRAVSSDWVCSLGGNSAGAAAVSATALALLRGGGVMDVIRHAGIGLDAAQQPHAGVQVVVHLAFVIAALALALGEDHIGHAGGVHIHQVLHIVGCHPVHAQFRGGLVDDLIHQTVDLLAIVGRSLGVTRAGNAGAPRGRRERPGCGTDPRSGLPHHTPVACDLPGGLLIHHGAFEPAQRGVTWLMT